MRVVLETEQQTVVSGGISLINVIPADFSLQQATWGNEPAIHRLLKAGEGGYWWDGKACLGANEKVVNYISGMLIWDRKDQWKKVTA